MPNNGGGLDWRRVLLETALRAYTATSAARVGIYVGSGAVFVASAVLLAMQPSFYGLLYLPGLFFTAWSMWPRDYQSLASPDQWRRWVREMVAEGFSVAQICEGLCKRIDEVVKFNEAINKHRYTLLRIAIFGVAAGVIISVIGGVKCTTG